MLCVDEKSQIQALDRTAPMLPMLPGTPEWATHDYQRAGTSSLYAALDLSTGKLNACYVRGPEGLIVELAQRLDDRASYGEPLVGDRAAGVPGDPPWCQWPPAPCDCSLSVPSIRSTRSSRSVMS